MPVVGLDVDRLELLRRDLLAGGVAALVEASADNETTAIRRVRDQVDDRLVASQRAAAPVDRDEREQAVLDLVPLARAGREVADANGDSELVGEALELVLPNARDRRCKAETQDKDTREEVFKHEAFKAEIERTYLAAEASAKASGLGHSEAWEAGVAAVCHRYHLAYYRGHGAVLERVATTPSKPKK